METTQQTNLDAAKLIKWLATQSQLADEGYKMEQGKPNFDAYALGRWSGERYALNRLLRLIESEHFDTEE